MATSGPLESVNINNRRFTVDGEATVIYALPGFINEEKSNGDGTSRQVKSRKVGRATAIPIVLDLDRGDLEFIQEAQDVKGHIPFSATDVSGIVYDGEGSIVDDPEYDTKEGTMEIAYNGGMKKQV